MSNDVFKSTERRVATRFEAHLSAELAAGTTLVPVTIHDVSSTGCGVEILTRDPDLADKIGAAGLLYLGADDRTPGVILPVSLCNKRLEGEVLRYGLKFHGRMSRKAETLLGMKAASAPESGRAVPCHLKSQVINHGDLPSPKCFTPLASGDI